MAPGHDEANIVSRNDRYHVAQKNGREGELAEAADPRSPPVSEERDRRLGENEVVFRAVNERIEGLNEAFGMVTETMSVVCECGNIACSQQIEISLPDYERVRADPTLFVVVPGHEIADAEDVAERRDTYNVVRKHPGDPAKVATENDPRG